MSYDLVVWIGERPESDRDAAAEFDERMRVYEESPAPTDDHIRAFVADLVARHPYGQDDGPWSVEPVLEEESGDLAYLTITFSGIERVEPDVRELAEVHGLVAYDPQRECLPGSTEESMAKDPVDPASPVDLERLAEVMGVRVAKIQRYAARIGATGPLDFTQALTVTLMHPDDRLVGERQWVDVLAAVRRWWSSVPGLDEPVLLGVGPRDVAVDDLDAGCQVFWDLTGYARKLVEGW